MSRLQLQFDRIDISLHGISAELAQAAVDGLESELTRRLQGLRWGNAAPALRELNVQLSEPRAGSSASELRALLVERIAGEIQRRAQEEGSA